VLRAVAGVVCYYVLGFVLFGVAFLPFARRLTAGLTPDQLAQHPPASYILGQGIGFLVAFGAATWIVGVRALRFNAQSLRLRPRFGPARGFGAGLAIGVLPAAVAMMLGVVVGGGGWARDGGALAAWALEAGKTGVVLAPSAVAEELMFRGLPLLLVAGLMGRSGAIVLMSVLFGTAHLGNPGVTAAAVGNVALAGILLSLAFYSPGGLWAAVGAHLGWNGALAVLGAPVSGLPFEIPFIDYRMGEPAWLTGGGFGPEGGLIATVALTATIVFAIRWIRKDPT